MGVGSEVYGAVSQGRKGVGIELKKSYFKQAIKHLNNINKGKQEGLFDSKGEGTRRKRRKR